MAKVYAYPSGECLGEASVELEEASMTAIEGVVLAAWDRDRDCYVPATPVDTYKGMAISVRMGPAHRKLRLIPGGLQRG